MSLKDQLQDERKAHRETKDKTSRHLREVQAELKRAKLMQATGLREIQARLGAPIIDQLILAFHARTEAADPLRSAPMENTMRVTHPSSEKMGDEATHHHRAVVNEAIRDVRRVIAKLESGIGVGETVRGYAPRCHKRGCSEYGKRQALDAKICRECGDPIS